MNRNIFSPRGTINSSIFILYYILLIILYFVGGLVFTNLIINHGFEPRCFIWVMLLIKVLLAFNYKKRIREVGVNSFWSIFLGLVFAFDAEIMGFCMLIKNQQTANLLFMILAVIILFIQPVIIALLPKKGE